MRLNSAKDLDVYKKAFSLAMEIFEISKRFPPEERFAPTGRLSVYSLMVILVIRSLVFWFLVCWFSVMVFGCRLSMPVCDSTKTDELGVVFAQKP